MLISSSIIIISSSSSSSLSLSLLLLLLLSLSLSVCAVCDIYIYTKYEIMLCSIHWKQGLSQASSVRYLREFLAQKL